MISMEESFRYSVEDDRKGTGYFMCWERSPGKGTKI